MAEDPILTYLKRYRKGRSKAVPSVVMERKFRIPGRRLRKKITALRRGGHPICSDETGYWYAANDAELGQTIQRFNHELGNSIKTRNGLVRARSAFAEEYVQMEIGGDSDR